MFFKEFVRFIKAVICVGIVQIIIILQMSLRPSNSDKPPSFLILISDIYVNWDS